jgi:hypothetical protein
MGTNNKPLYKMVFTLKDNAIPEKFAEVIDEMLACYKSTCEHRINGNVVEFSTSEPKYFGGMWGVILDTLDSMLFKYIDGVLWINCKTGEAEDVLTQFLEKRVKE